MRPLPRANAGTGVLWAPWALLALAACTAPTRVVTVNLPPGVTCLQAPLKLPTDADEIRVDGHGVSTLCGGLVIPSPRWRPLDASLAERVPVEARPHARMLDLPGDRLAAWSGGLAGPVHTGHGVVVTAAPTEIFVGERALEPAHWPDHGWASIAGVIDAGSVPRNDEPDLADPSRPRQAARGGTFVPADRSRMARWSGDDVWMHGYWNWDWSDERLPVAAVDATVGSVRLGLPHRYGLAQRGRFRVTNALGELDTPGECWIDRASARVVAWLPPGAEALPVTVSMLEAPLLALPGGPGAPRVTVTGVDFACTRGPAVTGTALKGARVEGCRFRNVGTTAVSLEGAGCVVSHCRFMDIGGTGVSLAGGDRVTLTPGGQTVQDCTFERCGRLERTYRPAIEITGVGQRVLHNELHDLPHMAVTYAGNEHRIEANHVHHVVQETGDAGAICIGRDWTSHGNVLRGNLVHHITGTDARFQNAFYVDDMASGVTLEDNLVVRCNWGMLIGGGRDVTVRNNAFVGCGKAVMFDARGVGWMAPRLANPATSTLHQRLAAMPVDQEPWRSRYPTLRTYLTDRFGRPVGGRVEGNALLETPPGRIEDRECVEESGTLQLPVPTGSSLEETCDRLIRQACEGSVTVGNARLGPVGPRR